MVTFQKYKDQNEYLENAGAKNESKFKIEEPKQKSRRVTKIVFYAKKEYLFWNYNGSLLDVHAIQIKGTDIQLN